MFGQLTLWNMDRSGRELSLVCVFTLLFSGISRLLLASSNHILNGIAIFTCIFSVVLMAACIILPVLLAWLDFRRYVYLDESYQVHSLPISNTGIVNAQVVSALVWCLIAVFCVVASIWLLLPASLMSQVEDIISVFTEQSSHGTLLFFLWFSGQLFLQTILYVFCGFIGLQAGYAKPDRQLGRTFLVGILTYFIAGLSMIGILFLVMFLQEGGLDFLNSDTLDPSLVLPVFRLCFLLALTIDLILYGICLYQSKKGLNLI